MLVFVLNNNNQPLMPTTARKARLLLRQGKAKVIKRTPFTIQLLHGSTGYKQEISLGVDAGTKHIGISTTTKKRVLFEAEVLLRVDIKELLATRRSYRSARRNRKTRYRQARFSNRTRPKGWLAPSVQNKVNSHLKVIQLVHGILPITNIFVEVAQFDIQKIKNLEIFGTEYQRGEQWGFWNVREYVLYRDKHKCQWCKGKSKDNILNVHHIESRKTGGDSPANLITLCETCHKKIHRDGLEENLKRQFPSLRDASQMAIMRWFIMGGIREMYPKAEHTYGYLTKNTRIRNELEKSHKVDARCISGNPLAQMPSITYLAKQVRGQNRQLHKTTVLKGGIRKANKSPRYVKGFQLFDKVKLEDQECFIFGRRGSGSFDVRLLDGTKIYAGINCKKLKLIEKASTLLVQVQK